MFANISYVSRRGSRRVTEETRQLNADVLIAGRGADCQIQLSDLTVRLAHVRITQIRTGRVLVEGLGWPPPHLAGVPG